MSSGFCITGEIYIYYCLLLRLLNQLNLKALRKTMATRKKGLEFAKYIREIITKSTGFEKHLEKIKITGGGDGSCTGEFKVEQEHVNRGDALHGGYTATLIDMFTTYALMSVPCHPGVSVNISINYLQAAKLGDELLIDAKIVRSGKKLAFIDCELRRKKDNFVIATGTQIKYVDFK